MSFGLTSASGLTDLERSGFPRAEAERQAGIEFGGYAN